jgi:hypothetical protein
MIQVFSIASAVLTFNIKHEEKEVMFENSRQNKDLQTGAAFR